MSKQLPNLLPRSKPLGSSQKLDEETQRSNLPDLKPVGYEPHIAQNEPENLWEDEIRRNLRQSEGLTLDQIIKDRQASGQLNLDNALIERNRDDAYRIAGREEAVKKLQNAPGTRNYAAKGRTQAAIVKQDMDNLIKQEQNWTSGPGGALGLGGVGIPGKETGHDRFKKAHTALVGSEMWEQTKLGGYHLGQMMADAPAFVYDIFATPQNLIAEKSGLDGLKTSSDRLGEILGVESNVVSDYYKQEAQKAEQYISKINPKYRQGIIDSFKEGDLDTGFRNLAGGILSSLQPSIAIMTSGGTLGAPGTIASGTVLFGAGKKAELDERSKMPEWKKNVVATTHGALEGLWETALGAGAIGKAFRNSIVKGFQRGGQEVAEKQGKKFLWDTWSRVIERNPALIPLGEGFEEWGTQISQNAVDKYVGDRPDISLTEGAGDAMLVGIGMGTGFSGGMYGLQSALRSEETSSNAQQENVERAKLARIIEERNRADYSEREQSALDTFRQTALESEIKKADPDTFQEITAEQLRTAEGKAPENVFISGDALIEAINADPVNVSPALEKVGVSQSEIQEAYKSGGDVTIPMSQYLAHVVGTEADASIEPHVRLNPKSMSRAEREEWEQNHADDAKRIIEEAGEARERDYQIDADAYRIEQAIENEIDSAGDPVTRKVAQANSRTWSSFFATMAKRGYLDNIKYQGSAWEAFKDFWPEVRRAETGDRARDEFERELNNEGLDTLQQRADTQFAQNVSENFRDWFGKSMIKTAEGQPIPLHHGTTRDFEIFEDRAGESTGHATSGLGHFFTLRKSEAKHYAGEDGQLVTAYVKMEKPYQMSLDEAQSFETVEESRAFKEGLQNQGYDSVVIKEKGIPPMFVAFSPTQIKSVHNQGTFDPNDPRILYQDGQTGPTFYSQMQAVLDKNLPGKGTAGQFLQMIQAWARKGQFKQEELEWSGVEEWLGSMDKKEKITKGQILDYLRANEIQIKEVSKSLDRYTEDEINEIIAESKFQSQSDFEDFYGSEEWAEMADPHLDNFWSSMSNIEKAAFEDYADFKEDYGLKYDMSDIFPQSVFEQAYSDFRDIFSTQEEAVEQLDIDTTGRDDTKFSEYQLPGGENYQELLLTLPRESKRIGLPDGWTVEKSTNSLGETAWNVRNSHGEMVAGGVPSRQRAIEVAQGFTPTQADRESGDYRSPHWDEPNVLAHVRFNERTDADGNRVLFIEEVQSDWHQEGRKKGYGVFDEAKATAKQIAQVEEDGFEVFDLDKEKRVAFYREKEPADTEANRLGQDTGDDTRFKAYPIQATYKFMVTDGQFSLEIQAKSESGAIKKAGKLLQGSEIPNAPFKTTWPMLTMKRMLRYAAENGFDKVAWTTGEMQAERYDLSKQVDSIEVSPFEVSPGRYSRDVDLNLASGTISEINLGVNDQGVIDESTQADLKGKRLDEVIGKDLAEKAMKTRKQATLEGRDLKVGGEGMKGFYDKMLPSMLQKYIKKWGAKVGQTETANTVAHSIPVTDQMRESVLRGQPLFQDETSPKGAVQFGTPSGQPLINLFERADESTFLHESGHIFLEFVNHIANQEGATPDLVQMWQDIGKEIGHDPAVSRISTEAHEQWAQSLEMYFREGHAPSTRLARAFQEFSAWLRRIYSNFTAQKSKPSPELKALFNRLFATDAEISEVEFQNESATSLFDLKNLESETKQEYQEKRNQAEAQSRDEALKSYTRAYLRAQGGKKQAEAQARQEASSRPEYEASAEAVNMGGLNAEIVREAVGEEVYKALLKKRVGLITKKGTVSPQTMADKYGYEDAATFLHTLQQTPSKTKFVRSRTEEIIREHAERAREEFDSSGLTPAQAAYHNDKQFKMLLTELDVIRGQTSGQVVSEETIRNTAKRILVEKEDIHKVDLQQFVHQEAEAGRKSKKAVTQENWEEAELWKTRQVINHAVILETRAARDGKTLLSQELLNTAKDGLAASKEAKEALDKIRKKEPPKRKQFVESDQALNEVLQDEKADIYAKQKALEKHIREFLPHQERSRVIHHIKNIAKGESVSGRQGLLEHAMLKVEQAHQRKAQKAALAKIDKLLKQKKPKRTKHGTQDNRRMDSEANKTVDLIRKARAMDQDQAMERASIILEKMENGREAISDEEISQFIIYQTFGGLESRSVVDAQKALDALQEIISTGRASWQAKETARKDQNRKNREQFLEEITGGQGYKTQEQERLESQKSFFRKMADNIRSFDDLSQSFEMLLDKLARKDTESAPLQSPTTDYFRRSALRATIREHAQTTARQEQLRKKMEEIFGKKGLSRTLKKNTQVLENTGVTRKTEDGRIEIPLSQNQAYKLWQLFQQPSLLDELADHGYDSETLEQVNKFMAPEVKKWARWQVEEFYPEYREGINDVYKELFYVEMPEIEGYSPVARVYEGKDKQDNEFLGERQGYLSSVLGSAVKTRVKNSRGFNLLDGDSVLFQHITQMEHFKAWGVPLQEMRSVLGAESVTAAIRQHHGKTANVALQSFLDRFATGGQERALMLGVLDKFRRNFTLSAIGGNPVVFAKQLASIPAFAMEIPTTDFAASFMQALANPIKAYRTLMQSEAMQARYTSGWDRDVMLAMREANFRGKGKIQTFAEAMMISTKLGDKLAIIAGGYSVFQHHYKKLQKEGYSKQDAKTEALHQFDIATKRSQQAGDVMDLSYFQGALGSLGKLFTMFMTAPLSYYRNSASALRNLASGRGSKSENIKRLAMSWVVLQSVFQFIASGFEWEDDKQLRAALLGPLNGLFILRDVTDSLAGALIEGRSPYFSVGTPPPLTTISKASRGLAGIHKLIEEGGDTDDIAKIINYLAESAGHLTGIPYEPMSRVYSGISDAVTGETDYPIRRMMGYSEKNLKEANE